MHTIIAPTNEELVQLTFHVHNTLIRADESKKMWDWIAEHAERINEAGFGACFGARQQMAAGELYSALGRAYDDTKHHDTKSVGYILQLMQSATIKNRDQLLSYLGKYKDKKYLGSKDDVSLLKFGVATIQRARPTPNNSDKMKRILSTRHECVAHSAVTRGCIGAKSDDIEFAISWGLEFCVMVERSFYGAAVMGNVRCPIMSMRRLAHKAGVITDPIFTASEA